MTYVYASANVSSFVKLRGGFVACSAPEKLSIIFLITTARQGADVCRDTRQLGRSTQKNISVYCGTPLWVPRTISLVNDSVALVNESVARYRCSVSVGERQQVFRLYGDKVVPTAGGYTEMAGVLSTANGQDPDDEKSNIQIDRNSLAQFGFKLVIYGEPSYWFHRDFVRPFKNALGRIVMDGASLKDCNLGFSPANISVLEQRKC